MNPNEVLVAGLLVAPVLVLMVLRSNAAIIFMSLCLGYVLMQFLGSDIQSFTELFMPRATLSTNVMKLGLVLFPPVFTTIFMFHSVRGVKLVLNVLPALGAGCLLALFIVPLLPPGTSHAITNAHFWQQALRFQTIVVGVSSLIALFVLWFSRPRHHDKRKDKH